MFSIIILNLSKQWVSLRHRSFHKNVCIHFCMCDLEFAPKDLRSPQALFESLAPAVRSKKCFALGLEETHASSKQGKLRRIPPVTTLHLEDKNSK